MKFRSFPLFLEANNSPSRLIQEFQLEKLDGIEIYSDINLHTGLCLMLNSLLPYFLKECPGTLTKLAISQVQKLLCTNLFQKREH